MRTIVTLLMLMLSLCLTACHNRDPVMIDSTGQTVNLKHHPGQWLILNYWAPWCSHCRDEIAEWNVFYQTHRSKVLIYGIDYDAIPLDKLKREAKRLGIVYPLLTTDPAKLLSLAPIESLPVSFIYNPQGQLVQTLHGPQTQASLDLAINTDEHEPF